MVLASGFGITWHGLDGVLYLLAALAFLIAMLEAFGSGFARWRSLNHAIGFTAAGLLLWVLTYLLHGG